MAWLISTINNSQFSKYLAFWSRVVGRTKVQRTNDHQNNFIIQFTLHVNSTTYPNCGESNFNPTRLKLKEFKCCSQLAPSRNNINQIINPTNNGYENKHQDPKLHPYHEPRQCRGNGSQTNEKESVQTEIWAWVDFRFVARRGEPRAAASRSMDENATAALHDSRWSDAKERKTGSVGGHLREIQRRLTKMRKRKKMEIGGNFANGETMRTTTNASAELQ